MLTSSLRLDAVLRRAVVNVRVFIPVVLAIITNVRVSFDCTLDVIVT